MTWTFTAAGIHRIRIRHYGKPIFKGVTSPGMAVTKLKIGDAVYQKIDRPVNGQSWMLRFRLRMARGKPAVHLGKKFGDKWYWIHTKTGQAIMNGLIPRRHHA